MSSSSGWMLGRSAILLISRAFHRVHLVPLLQRLGHSERIAILVTMLIRPMPVAGRTLERTVARNTSPQTDKFCFNGLPAALIAIFCLGTEASAVALFCILYGLSNGVITTVGGTLPQSMFGSEHYGAISSALAGPALLAKASGPMIASWILRRGGSASVLLMALFVIALASVILYFAGIRTGRSDEMTRSNVLH